MWGKKGKTAEINVLGNVMYLCLAVSPAANFFNLKIMC